jgi:hypothetical protein
VLEFDALLDVVNSRHARGLSLNWLVIDLDSLARIAMLFFF